MLDEVPLKEISRKAVRVEGFGPRTCAVGGGHQPTGSRPAPFGAANGRSRDASTAAKA